MRIIAGTARRVQLEVADGTTTRPFLEMARGALFNSLGGSVIGARVLDLYAGSGALGLEALSRGAAFCLFVERDPVAFASLRRNIGKCGATGRARTSRSDVEKALAENDGEFDLVFVDPPFAELAEWRADGRAGPIMIGAADRLAAGGMLVFRLEGGKFTPPAWPGLVLASERRYGRSRVCRYGKEAST